MTSNALASGWQRDPDDPNLFRWFDGTSFTDQTRAAGPGLQVHVTTAAQLHADDSAWYRFPERVDREYPSFDHAALAQDDQREWRNYRRRRWAGIAGGLILVASGGTALIVLVPLGIVALFIAAGYWISGRGASQKARVALRRWGTMLGFTDEGGTLWTRDGATIMQPGETGTTLRALRAAGMQITHEFGRFRGTPWRAGEGTTVQQVQLQAEFRRYPQKATIVTVPLHPEIAERYAGLAVERPRGKMGYRLRAWPEWEHAPDATGVHVTAHPAQRSDVPAWHPIVQMGYDWAWGLEGWVVADGQLSVWCTQDVLTRIGEEQVLIDKGKKVKRAALAETRLARLLDQARHLQYLLYDPEAVPSTEGVDWRSVN